MNWSDVPRQPTTRVLRQFGGLCLLFFGMLACRCALRGADWAAVTLGLLAACGGLAGLLRPRWLRPVFVGWMVLVYPVGWLVSRAVLALVFYCVLTPLALAFRWTGRDVLGLRRVARQTYWEEKAEPDGPAEYLRQY
jgi:hypothetical protein